MLWHKIADLDYLLPLSLTALQQKIMTSEVWEWDRVTVSDGCISESSMESQLKGDNGWKLVKSDA